MLELFSASSHPMECISQKFNCIHWEPAESSAGEHYNDNKANEQVLY